MRVWFVHGQFRKLGGSLDKFHMHGNMEVDVVKEMMAWDEKFVASTQMEDDEKSRLYVFSDDCMIIK